MNLDVSPDGREIGLDRDLGSIEAGKLADLVVLTGNPLDDLRHSRDIAYVMANGRLNEAVTLNEVWPEARPRRPLWFEREGASDAAVWRDGITLEGDHDVCETP